MKVEVAPNGNTRYIIRQSWFDTWINMCQASARWDTVVFPDGTPPSTATAIGTAMHAGIAAHLTGDNDPITAIADAWVHEREVVGFRADPTTPDRDAVRIAGACYEAWKRDILPTLGEVQSIEHDFEVMVDDMKLPDGTLEELWIRGTWDAMIDGVLWDWKTGSNPQHYTQSVIDRKIQASVYTFAAAMLGLVDPNEVTFKYGVAYKRKTMDCPTAVATTTRTPRDWAFLVEQMWRCVDAWKADTAQLNDGGWWCSPKFCEHFVTCKAAPQPVPYRLALAGSF